MTRLVLILVAASLASECGGSDGGGETSPATPSAATTQATTTTTAGPTRVVINVQGGTPKGGIERFDVRKGDRLVIVVRSDVADELHVHGYDLMRDVAAGGIARIAFTADLTGSFEIELEQRHSLLAEFEVRP